MFAIPTVVARAIAFLAVEGQPVAHGLIATELRRRLGLVTGGTGLRLHGRGAGYGEWSLPSLLYVGSNKLLGIGLEYLVDLVEDRVDILGHFLVALGDVGVDRGLDLVGLLARARRLLLPAGVPGGHVVLRCCSWLMPARKLPPGGDIPGHPEVSVDQPPVIVSTSSCAVAEASNSAPTCSRVPRSGSMVGMRTRFSRPRSKTTESHEAAATCAG